MLDDTRHWAPTCRALGLEDLVGDPRFGDTATRAEHRVELHDLLAARIGSLALSELRDRLSAEDTIYSALASPLEVVDDPQVLANGYLAAHPNRPSVRLACAPMQFDNEMTAVRRPAPDTGEHTDEILDELGYDSATMASLRESGAVA
jgi:crotonobetainyl-CoA:carnitine CoA-transferase CaiB-like acyl-CoA transferase